MTTCTTIVTSAFRRSGILPALGTPAAADTTIGLERLNGMYMKWLGAGLFGQLVDYYLASGNYTIKENQRVYKKVATGTITYPTFLVDESSGVTRPIKDGSIVVVVDVATNVPIFKIYDAMFARWDNAYNLVAGDTAPLSGRHEEALKNCLAVELCDEYGQAVSTVLARNAVTGRLSIMSRHENPRGPTGVGASVKPEFF